MISRLLRNAIIFDSLSLSHNSRNRTRFFLLIVSLQESLTNEDPIISILFMDIILILMDLREALQCFYDLSLGFS